MTNNILLYLIPKSQVAYVYCDATVRQVMEKLDFHGYTAIPVLTKDGKYFGTVTEGDILREFKRDNFLTIFDSEKVLVKNMNRKHDCTPIHSTETMSNLLETASEQNFIPVIDDSDNFIGIITRKAIIKKALNDLHNKE